jgi:succinoglycan biosynthesis transport protein ExoP
MNQPNHDQRLDADLFIDEPAGVDSGSHTLQIHALMRGRYHWAIILGLVLATAGAFTGYFSQGDVYRSTSLIAVSPVSQTILSTRGDDSLTRHFGSWVDKQLAIIEGPKVLEPAMTSDDWQSVSFGAYSTSPIVFRKGMSVSHKRGQEVIAISYEAPLPELAQVGANVITNAYKAELERSEQLQDSQRQRVLENLKLDLQRKIEKLQADKRALSTDHNERTIGDELDRITLARDRLEADLNQTRLELAELGVSASGDPSPDQFSLEQLATQDPRLGSMLQTRNQIESDIDYKTRLGMGDRHREIRDARAALDTINSQIEKLANSLRGTTDGSWSPDGSGGIDTSSPILALRSKEKRLSKQYEDAKAETQHLAMIYGQMQTIASDLKRKDNELTHTVSLLDNLRVEGQAAGRAEVIRTGGLPSKPYNVGKRKQLAVLGGMAGLCAGFGMVILFGMTDRRLRHFEDAQIGLGSIRMLGVLPELPDDLTDPEQAITASHCVHQIRTLLQIDRGHDGFILSITGPAAGSGKTSLTMALGMSFSTSGSKTLMIDCDIVGGGLTRRMLDNSNTKQNFGVLEACNGTAFSDCVINTAFNNLDILPIGSALPSQAGDLSPAAVSKLLAKARGEYDTILVDTGPILGSLESAMVSAQADKTVVIVSRGDQKPVVAKSLEHLRSIGANLVGVVFNHADAVDIERSTYASVTVSLSRMQDDKMLNEVKWIDRDTSNRYGPLATAVASYGRSTDGIEDDHA